MFVQASVLVQASMFVQASAIVEASMLIQASVFVTDDIKGTSSLRNLPFAVNYESVVICSIFLSFTECLAKVPFIKHHSMMITGVGDKKISWSKFTHTFL
jgi:hypothetical protein